MQNCPKCQSTNFFFVQTVREYYSIAAMPDENGNVDTGKLIDTATDESRDPYLKCIGCGAKTDLKGEPLDA